MGVNELSIGLVQVRCGEDLEANSRKTITGIREAASRGAKIICTQELFRSTYFCQQEDATCFRLAESIPGPTTDLLQSLARELEVVIVGSLFEQRAPGLYHNTAVVIDADGALLGAYRKMHIPDDPGFYEKYYFTPGDQGFVAWETKYAKIGVLVCWDQWFPEAARLTALKGAEILFYPTAIGWLPSEKETLGEEQVDAWQTIQRSHAIANGCYLVSVNRVGVERSSNGEVIEFWGRSFVVAPSGKVVQEASDSHEEILSVPVDLKQITETRQAWPFFRDRRIDAYNGLERRFID